MKRLSVALGLALCVALPASAQMYKWVDSDGKVQYSDKPPPSNIKSEKLRGPASAASAPAAGEGKDGTQKDAAKGGEQKDAAKAGPRTALEQDQAFRKRQMDAAKAQEKEAQKQAEARDRAENCKRAKAALANLQIGGRQVRVDEKGERVYLDDQQIVRETARAREEAAAACN
jgi:FKBP-type peptidyl-prolyl cis-trans isomerase